MKYSREQLIQAMHKWNKHYLKDPEAFEAELDDSVECAEGCVDTLLSYIEEAPSLDIKLTKDYLDVQD